MRHPAADSNHAGSHALQLVAPGQPPAAGMPEKRILLVEDERSTRESLWHFLWREGYRVDIAETFPEAITFLDTVTYDLVISDWRLPEGNGLLLADIAAELGAVTMVMSGYLFQMPGGRAERHETLMKPLWPKEVVAAVERAIGKAGVSR
jgi:DNA-binding response OmpR family regulator